MDSDWLWHRRAQFDSAQHWGAQCEQMTITLNCNHNGRSHQCVVCQTNEKWWDTTRLSDAVDQERILFSSDEIKIASTNLDTFWFASAFFCRSVIWWQSWRHQGHELSLMQHFQCVFLGGIKNNKNKVFRIIYGHLNLRTKHSHLNRIKLEQVGRMLESTPPGSSLLFHN